MREDGTYDASAFRERLATVEAEIGALTVVSAEPDLEAIDPVVLRTSARWFLEHIALIWEKLPDSSRSRFERIAFPNGIRYDRRTRFRTAVPGPILAISATVGTSQSHRVHLDGISSNQLYECFRDLIALHSELRLIVLGGAKAA